MPPTLVDKIKSCGNNATSALFATLTMLMYPDSVYRKASLDTITSPPMKDNDFPKGPSRSLPSIVKDRGESVRKPNVDTGAIVNELDEGF